MTQADQDVSTWQQPLEIVAAGARCRAVSECNFVHNGLDIPAVPPPRPRARLLFYGTAASATLFLPIFRPRGHVLGVPAPNADVDIPSALRELGANPAELLRIASLSFVQDMLPGEIIVKHLPHRSFSLIVIRRRLVIDI